MQAAKGSPFTPVTDPQAEATYLPTGGTTAAPKLVRMTHKGQLINAAIRTLLCTLLAEYRIALSVPKPTLPMWCTQLRD